MKPRYSTVSVFVVALLVATLPVAAQEVLPQPSEPFKGKIGRTVKDSIPDFSQGGLGSFGGAKHLADHDGRRRFRRQ